MNYSTAAINASAVVSTKGKDDSVTVNKGDTLTNVTLVESGTERTISTATVMGFIVGTRKSVSGDSTVLDGIPTYMYDREGDPHFGTVDELYEVTGIVISVPGETEDDPAVSSVIKVANIKALTVTPADDESEETEDNKGSDPVTPPVSGG